MTTHSFESSKNVAYQAPCSHANLAIFCPLDLPNWSFHELTICIHEA